MSKIAAVHLYVSILINYQYVMINYLIYIRILFRLLNATMCNKARYSCVRACVCVCVVYDKISNEVCLLLYNATVCACKIF